MKNLEKPAGQPVLRVRFVFLFIFSVTMMAFLAAYGAAQAPAADSPAIEIKAHDMLGKLSLEEKVLLIGGVEDMYTNAVPSVGLPRFKMSDASVGVRTWGPTTAYAGGAALAATLRHGGESI